MDSMRSRSKAVGIRTKVWGELLGWELMGQIIWEWGRARKAGGGQ
jgi:hypothetical protein